MEPNLHRDLGKVEGRLESLTNQVKGIDAKLDEALEYIHTQKGSRRATIAISSAISSVIAFAVGVLVNIFGPHA
jgi:hypothetical protein